MSYVNALSGMAGFVTGFLATPAAMALGGGAGEVFFHISGLQKEERILPACVGAVAGATLLVGVAEALPISPFYTGIKVAAKIAAVGLSIITGLLTGAICVTSMKLQNHRADAVGGGIAIALIGIPGLIISAITGIFTAIASAYFIHPAAGVVAGAVNAGLLNYAVVLIFV